MISVNQLENFPGAGASVDGAITWESKPNRDGWGWDSYWSCNNWITWHKELFKKYGKEEADRLWVNEYDQASYGAHEIQCSTQSDDFKKYVLTNGIAAKSSILSRVYRAELAINQVIVTPAKNISDAINEATEGVGNLGESLGTVLKWLPWIALGGALLFLYFYFKPFAKAAA